MIDFFLQNLSSMETFFPTIMASRVLLHAQTFYVELDGLEMEAKSTASFRKKYDFFQQSLQTKESDITSAVSQHNAVFWATQGQIEYMQLNLHVKGFSHIWNFG